jgi:chorismate dehydratase
LEKIKVGIVNYLNTKPLLYGIHRSAVMEQMELVPDFPANVARDLLAGTIDMGLVPVAIISKLKEAHIVGNYGIGADGVVASVCLLSQVPMDEIQEVLLDYQSRTSAALVQVLLEKYWKKKVIFIDTQEEFSDRIKGSTAGLVIGDRCLSLRNKMPYVYDLGEAWKNFTGLPFVFACWVSNKVLPETFVTAFNEANKAGLDQIDKVVAEVNFPEYDLHTYYTKNISYFLDDRKIQGLKLFLSYIV